MGNFPTKDQINLYRSIFKGRADVFAIRWEKGKKNGYMPAYKYDPYLYRIHRMKGGSFKNYEDKTFQTLNDDEVRKHISGKQFIGIYPLLKNNTSFFIAADFDGKNWEESCRKLINACREIDLPVYLERSRSGNGGHVWMFFEEAYPAAKSRKIMSSLLAQIGSISIFDKEESFDRLFPNQDYLSGKGMGNLIALPLHQPLVEQGNNCFINPETLAVYPDQWVFLQNVKKVSNSQLEQVYTSFQATLPKAQNHPMKAVQIALDHSIRITLAGLKIELINYLKEELHFANAEFFIKQHSGKNNWETKRYTKLIQEEGNEIVVPRGFIGKLLRFCQQQKIDYEFLDKRNKRPPVAFDCHLTLRPHQEKVIKIIEKKDFGVIVAPPGTGKTIIGLKTIAEKRQPTLIVVHRKHLLDQWIERIESFMGIPKKEIGKIGQGRQTIGKQVTIAMIQSLAKKATKDELKDLTEQFGLLLVDECHHLPAASFYNTLGKFNTYYQYGLTATPFRKNKDEKLIFAQRGEILIELKPEEIESYQRARIIVRNTNLSVPFNIKTDPFETLSKILIHDTARNNLILNDLNYELQKGNKAVIITERQDHIQTLEQLLKTSYETITLSGQDTERSRKGKWEVLHAGNFQVVITTGQFFGEGTDLQNVSRLFLVYPFSFKGKLIQYIGRVQRSEIRPVIYDYRDHKIDYLDRLFLKRNKYYRHLDRHASLFEDQDLSPTHPKVLRINKQIKLSWEDLDFQFGTIGFNYQPVELNQALTFEIEQDYIRPEFEVLKPYFSKLLNLSKLEIDIHVEMEDNQVVAQLATCPALEKINRAVIEGVKFRYFDKTVIGSTLPLDTESNLLSLDQIQGDGDTGKLYESEAALLAAILENKQVKHDRQLRYLADRHDGTILKLRFVLQPFSFVFLLVGKAQFHMVLETLDTEEATYIWHLENDPNLLLDKLKAIDEDLATIKNNGRQAFLATAPKAFSRIIHHYANERKGFVVWRDMLEERLY